MLPTPRMRALLFLLASTLGCGGDPPPPEPAPVSSVGDEVPQSTEPAPAPVGPSWDDRTDPNETPRDVAEVPPYATVTESGLASYVLRSSINAIGPTAESRVTVHYAGWTTDGALFDSSWQRGRPATFPLRGVIAGWAEGVQLMREGEIRRFWIPPELAYGNTPVGNRPTGMLVFDVELISVDSHSVRE